MTQKRYLLHSFPTSWNLETTLSTSTPQAVKLMTPVRLEAALILPESCQVIMIRILILHRLYIKQTILISTIRYISDTLRRARVHSPPLSLSAHLQVKMSTPLQLSLRGLNLLLPTLLVAST